MDEALGNAIVEEVYPHALGSVPHWVRTSSGSISTAATPLSVSHQRRKGNKKLVFQGEKNA